MTPLKLQILLHYYAMATDYRDGDLSAPAVAEAVQDFLAGDMLQRGENSWGAAYSITERGRAHVENLCRLPFPILRWVPAGSLVGDL